MNTKGKPVSLASVKREALQIIREEGKPIEKLILFGNILLHQIGQEFKPITVEQAVDHFYAE